MKSIHPSSLNLVEFIDTLVKTQWSGFSGGLTPSGIFKEQHYRISLTICILQIYSELSVVRLNIIGIVIGAALIHEILGPLVSKIAPKKSGDIK